jgi:hypothetical protein
MNIARQHEYFQVLYTDRQTFITLKGFMSHNFSIYSIYLTYIQEKLSNSESV